MPDQRAKVGEQQSLEIFHDRTRAWWTSVLAGQIEQTHPVHTNIKAKLEGGTLIVTGTVPSEDDRDEIEREVEHLRGNGVSEIRDELTVEPEVVDEKGLLVQTLLAMFESEEQAGFAEGFLEGHANIEPDRMQVIAPEGDSVPVATHESLPEEYWQDAERALEAGRTLLIVTVDETEAFKTRELLDEETRSLETIVLPPEAARNPTAALRAERAARSAPREAGYQRAQGARQAIREQENSIHER